MKHAEDTPPTKYVEIIGDYIVTVVTEGEEVREVELEGATNYGIVSLYKNKFSSKAPLHSVIDLLRYTINILEEEYNGLSEG